MPKKKLLVFLSHASEDKPIVRKLCKQLSDDGFNPWFDEEHLLPGQDWNFEIEKALRQSDSILVCFSQQSYAKEGYIQREYKKAMDYQLEKPEGAIFVIPVRLDDCEIPFFLRELQYVDYPSGYEKLLKSLDIRAGRLTSAKKPRGMKSKENTEQNATKHMPDQFNKLPFSPTQNSNNGGINISGNLGYIGKDVIGRDQVVTTNIVYEDTAYNVEGLPNPYLGLKAFQYDDRDRYAGRENLAIEAMQMLVAPGEQSNLLFITGASGSGKSSFVQAGLLPLIISHYSQRNIDVIFDVFHPAHKPLARLADAQRRFVSGKVQVIIIDQFEELFTQSIPSERDAVLNWLMELLPFEQSHQHVVATLRSDYLGEIFDIPTLWSIVKQGIELHSMSLDETKEAIQRPLQARYANSNKRFEPKLVEKLAKDAIESVTYLPLLQVSLEDIWKKGQLKLSSYNSLTDAIKERADTVLKYRDFDKASPKEARTEAERKELLEVLLNLVNTSLDDDIRRDVRISRHLNEFTIGQKAVIYDLSHARLLSVENAESEEVVNLIHETLIRSWDVLSDGIKAKRVQLQRRARFEAQLRLWLANGRLEDYLLSKGQLTDARDLEKLGDIALQTEESQRFFQSSILKLESEQRQARLPAIIAAMSNLAKASLNEQDLLSSILERAVEILNTEAGSLLLVDAQTGDLVFRAVSGLVKGDVLGQHIPANTGLVGHVLQTRMAIIENNPEKIFSDLVYTENHEGFKLNSVMVIPMQANNRVLGVIEVVNRKDGISFTVDDQGLLTVFASQATNLLTDYELASSVEELSVMQRINRELNATLEIDRAMGITLNWALRQSRAEAGLIGILEFVSEEVRLNVMSQQGFDKYMEGLPDQTFQVVIPSMLAALEGGQPQRLTVTNSTDKLLPNAHTQTVIPIRRETIVIGLLYLENTSDSLPDIEFLTRLADQAAIAISNAQLYGELQRSNYAKSDFVSFVAHELKNPMTSIKGYTELIAGGAVGQVNEMQTNFLYTIKSNIERMSTLVSDLNDDAKIEAGRLRLEYKVTTVAEIVDEVAANMKRQIDDKKQVLDILIPQNMRPIWADRIRVGQALTNLLSNAYKYTPENGTMQIGGEESENHWDTEGAPWVIHLWVKDNGIGLTMEDQQKIFQRFFRSDDPKAREAPGTGLGLNITKSLVEMQGGRIWFESEFRKGSTFHFTIPVAEG